MKTKSMFSVVRYYSCINLQYLLNVRSWLGMLVVLHVLCMLM